MGVPKFFRWCAERYPSIITPFKEAPPPVDNLYLDMNGIIHNCSHPNDVDVKNAAPTEKEMVQLMFTYLDKLFGAIRPRKHFLLAVDGVAPRAKMNQQRQRRYRSAYDMMVAREEAKAKGEDIPDEKDVFDSNCITPGTGFMVRVSKELQYFITMKLSTDSTWQNCKVIFSGHDDPGEGEHKIVDFIRRRKSQPGYDPNETHCMYGLDADLVMLSLATHEPHFLLLREVVEFGPSSYKERMKLKENESKGLVVEKSYQKADEFVLLHVSLLRDYLDLDIREQLGSRLTKEYDLERVLDDFVFMCFFIGNDFLPSIPTLGIHDGSMLTMIQIYCNTILSRNLYLTNKGVVNWHTTEAFLVELGKLELETIKRRQIEEEQHQNRLARHDPSHEIPVSTTLTFETVAEYKHHFYRKKHNFSAGWDPLGKDIQDLKKHYMEGLIWVIGYYYQGPQSWKWYYPHYYAPMASDLTNLASIAATIKFDAGKPFLPHQQLLAVLPPMSYRSIPKAYWPLLRSASSPLVKYFPEHLLIDKEGARAPWEGVVLIPFIREDVLLAAYNSVQKDLTPEDISNNTPGPPVHFSYDPKMEPWVLNSEMFGPLKNITVRRESFEFPPMKGPFRPELCNGVYLRGKQLEGISTFQSKIQYISPIYKSAVVSIFGRPTKNESMLLKIKSENVYESAADVAFLLGKEVLVGYPHLKRARVASIGDLRTIVNCTYTKDGVFSGSTVQQRTPEETAAFKADSDQYTSYMRGKLGIEADDMRIFVYVHRACGMRITPNRRLVRQYATTTVSYPLCLVSRIENLSLVEDARYRERDCSELGCESGSRCIYIGKEPKGKKANIVLYGSPGAVIESPTDVSRNENFSVCLKVRSSTFTIPKSIANFTSESNWMSMAEVANMLQLNSRVLSTICSSMTTCQLFGSQEIGLCMKFSGRSIARLGYAKFIQRRVNPWQLYSTDIFSRMETDPDATAMNEMMSKVGDRYEHGGRGAPNHGNRGTWYFSGKAVQLVKDYVQEFRPMIEYIESANFNTDAINPQNFLFGAFEDLNAEEVIEKILDFLSNSGIASVPMIEAIEEVLPREFLKELEEALQTEQKIAPAPREVVLKGLTRQSLFFPITRSTDGHLISLRLPRETVFRLGSRVVNCHPFGKVPFGMPGTIIRLLASGRDAEVMYDEPFLGGSRLEGRLRDPRGAITGLSALLPLSGAIKSEDPLDTFLDSVKNPTNESRPVQVKDPNKPDKASLPVPVEKKSLDSIPETTQTPTQNSIFKTVAPMTAATAHLSTKDFSLSAPAKSGADLVDLLSKAVSPKNITIQSTNASPPSNNDPSKSDINLNSKTSPPIIDLLNKHMEGINRTEPNIPQSSNVESPALDKPKQQHIIPDVFMSGKISLDYRNILSQFNDRLERKLNEELEKSLKRFSGSK